MKTPSGTFIVIILTMIAIASILIFQACATTAGGGPTVSKRFTLQIGKDKDTFVEFKKGGKPQFDSKLRALGIANYKIRYKADPTATPVEDYHPPKVALKTDNVTTSEVAKNEPPGDPHVTQKVQSDYIADIEDVLNTLK
jgi:hypothetical protein